ncbi:MAG: stage IV sporulation protein A [Eubacterium sp.]|nr:stage IV sporulation protein A [Eubacterium sp.]MDD7209555.1 stage IV sporulation protein A [Lachnospiraceae bacterium]MDY5498439.1 stage IV sporulation protein A [Anaerobutyricum sp.]
MEKQNIYQDIFARTKGEIYLGVVGPVRSGKSTFIKRFMELMVLPEIRDENERKRAMDELPQSGTGKTVMTTEPKFIPKEAAELAVEDMKIKVRLIDCVGFLIEQAQGHMENGQERLVKTPWFDYEVPFSKAAEYGTRKVIRDHSTIGIIVTADGSFGEIPRDSYVEAEKRTVEELTAIGKPFVILLNSERPYSRSTQTLAKKLTQEYKTTVMPVNCDQLRQEDILEILKNVLLEFPLSSVGFYLPKWVETLRDDHWMKKSILDLVREFMAEKRKMKDLYQKAVPENEYISSGKIEKIHMDTGEVDIKIQIRDSYYYEILSDLTGLPIRSEYHLIRLMKELAGKKKEFEEVSQALSDARQRGYGVMKPVLSEITLSEPEVVKHGGKYGVKIRAQAPSIHLIRANLTTEIAPIVGTQLQAEDLITYIKEQAGGEPEKIWNVNIFGKTLEQLVDDGISSKVTRINEDSQEKLQNAMEKIVNESSGGLICIII